ncbi:DUF6538 domain-containing protein [Cupriavidus basilensis]
MATNIQKRGSVYYFRRKIPLDLIEQHNGKREIIRSFGHEGPSRGRTSGTQGIC